jgi:hypothetical protein
MATMPGSNLPGILYGTIDGDLIDGPWADDFGFYGNDTLTGSATADTLWGGSDTDVAQDAGGDDSPGADDPTGLFRRSVCMAARAMTRWPGATTITC